jgi:uncharacterized protein with PQ loop repeat
MFFKKFKKIENVVKYEVKTHIDKLFYFGGVLSPIATFPQVIKIFFEKNVNGLSIETWTMYFLGAVAMLLYGLVHRQKPIIFMNVVVLPFYLLIIVGILIYG